MRYRVVTTETVNADSPAQAEERVLLGDGLTADVQAFELHYDATWLPEQMRAALAPIWFCHETSMRRWTTVIGGRSYVTNGHAAYLVESGEVVGAETKPWPGGFDKWTDVEPGREAETPDGQPVQYFGPARIQGKYRDVARLIFFGRGTWKHELRKCAVGLFDGDVPLAIIMEIVGPDGVRP